MAEDDWTPPPFKLRVVAAVFLVCLITAYLSYFLGWNLFGGYDRQVALAVSVVGAFIVLAREG